MQWFGVPSAEEHQQRQTDKGQSRTRSQGQREVTITSQEVEQFFLDYVSQKKIAEGDLPDLEEEEEAGQCSAWLQRSMVSLQGDCDL